MPKKLQKFPKEIGKKFPAGRGDVPPPPPRPPLQFAIENEYLGLTNGKISNYPTTHIPWIEFQPYGWKSYYPVRIPNPW